LRDLGSVVGLLSRASCAVYTTDVVRDGLAVKTTCGCYSTILVASLVQERCQFLAVLKQCGLILTQCGPERRVILSECGPEMGDVFRPGDLCSRAATGSGSFCITLKVAVGIRYVSKSRYWRLPVTQISPARSRSRSSANAQCRSIPSDAKCPGVGAGPQGRRDPRHRTDPLGPLGQVRRAVLSSESKSLTPWRQRGFAP